MSSLLLALTGLVLGLRIPLAALGHGFAPLAAARQEAGSRLAEPLAIYDRLLVPRSIIRRTGCVQLVARKKGCSKAQNRKATKPGDAAVMSKRRKISGAHGKGIFH